MNGKDYYVAIPHYNGIVLRKKVVAGTESPPNPAIVWEASYVGQMYEAATYINMFNTDIPRRSFNLTYQEKAAENSLLPLSLFSVLYDHLKQHLIEIGASNIQQA